MSKGGGAIPESRIAIKKQKTKMSLRLLNVMLLSVFMLLGVWYLVLIANMSTKGFELKQTKDKLAELTEENQAMEIAITGKKSYQYLSQQVEKLDMVPVENPRYLAAADIFVAKK